MKHAGDRRRLVFVSATLSAVLSSLATPASSQVATLAADLQPSSSFTLGSSAPRDFVELGGRALFLANLDYAEEGIFTSDGTATGTELLQRVGLASSFAGAAGLIRGGGFVYWIANAPGSTCESAPRLFRTDGTRDGTMALTGCGVQVVSTYVFHRGKLYFLTGGFPGPTAVWATDGTPAGTVMLSESSGTLNDYSPLLAVGAHVVWAQNTFDGSNLFRSDGTPEGTEMFARTGSLFPYRGRIVAAGSRAFFLQFQGNGDQLWLTDTTAAGTRRVPLPPGTSLDATRNLDVVGEMVAFFATDQSEGTELYLSDGTAAGTRRVTKTPAGFRAWDFAPGARNVVRVGNFYFALATEDGFNPALMSTDGDPNHTQRILGEPEGPVPDLEFPPIASHGRLIFRVYTPDGQQVWGTNGTLAGTGPAFQGTGESTIIHDLFERHGVALFVASEPGQGADLYRTDGTAAGTRRMTRFGIEQPFPVSQGVRGAYVGRLGERWLLGAREGDNGTELWVSDGTPPGTTLVADLGLGALGSDPRLLRALAGRAVFKACGGSQASVWTSRGTAATTTRLTTPDLESCPASATADLVTAGGLAYFVAQFGDLPTGIYRTDGTADGTFRIFPTNPDAEFYDFRDTSLFSAGDELYFTAGDFQTKALWRTDGTLAGTVEVLPATGSMRHVHGGAYSLGELYFAGVDAEHGTELWKTDGTLAGTVRLTNLEDDDEEIRNPLVIAELGGALFFLTEPGTGGPLRIWRTDGTAAGTEVLGSLTTPETGTGDSRLIPFAGRLLYTGYAPGNTYALWAFDPETRQNSIVHSFAIDGSFNIPVTEATAFMGTLVFVAKDPVLGVELWSTDGTTAGTRLLTDVWSGGGSSRPQGLVVAGNRLYFTADDGVHGRELWVTDGTALGTRLVHDLAPGPTSSQPDELTVAGNRLYFTADDRVSGRELWSVDLSGNPATCPPSETALCLQNDRFRVEIAWRDFQGRTGVGQPTELTADTGTFWFFRPENVETIVKVLDGRGVNGHFWTFYGALSSVEYAMTVTDSQTGLTQRYYNPARQLASVGDTLSFGPQGASLASFTAPEEALLAQAEPAVEALFTRGAGSCAPASNRLCLQGDRFALEATWRDFQGRTGIGTAVELTPDTGYFWFFNQANIEVVTKVLDGRPVNGKFWLFYGALSNVEYTLTVTDTQTGNLKRYHNPLRNFASVADTGAF